MDKITHNAVTEPLLSYLCYARLTYILFRSFLTAVLAIAAMCEIFFKNRQNDLY